jgi:integrase
MKRKNANFTDEAKTEARKYSSRGSSSLAKFTSSNGSAYGTLALDTRRATDDDTQALPVAVRVAYNGKSIYLRIGKKYTKDEWMDLCECKRQARNKKAGERKELKTLMQRVEKMINEMIDDESFSLNKLQERFTGFAPEGKTIYSVWEKYIEERAETSLGTAKTNKDVMNSFIKDMGSNVSFADINRSFIMKWVKKMKNRELRDSTIGIRLRTFRAIVNVCIDEGLIKGDTKEMFKDSGYNKSNSRKHEFLDVPTMKRLYDFWEKGEAKDDDGKELFYPQEKEAMFRDLGLFLFMYLGDGQNLADTLRLEYDEWYFATHGQQFRFLRHKTEGRSEDDSEVIFPITPEIKKILDKYANPPLLGSRVFPIMKEGIPAETELWTIQRYNKYIGKHMAKVAEILKMDQEPTSTWARHSFATNLNNSGKVPHKYISDSMGHSGGGDITSIYIGTYPYEKMTEYNAYLLYEHGLKSEDDVILEILKGLSAEERKRIIKAASKLNKS